MYFCFFGGNGWNLLAVNRFLQFHERRHAVLRNLANAVGRNVEQQVSSGGNLPTLTIFTDCSG